MPSVAALANESPTATSRGQRRITGRRPRDQDVEEADANGPEAELTAAELIHPAESEAEAIHPAESEAEAIHPAESEADSAATHSGLTMRSISTPKPDFSYIA